MLPGSVTDRTQRVQPDVGNKSYTGVTPSQKGPPSNMDILPNKNGPSIARGPGTHQPRRKVPKVSEGDGYK